MATVLDSIALYTLITFLLKPCNCKGRIVTIINTIIIITGSISMPIHSPDGKTEVQRLNNLPKATKLVRTRFRAWIQVCVTSSAQSVSLCLPHRDGLKSEYSWGWHQYAVWPGTRCLSSLRCHFPVCKQEHETASSLAPCSFIILPLSEGMQVENRS